MPDGNVDVLMKVVSKGSAMMAESSTAFLVDKVVDRLREGFEPGRYFELQEFSFSAGVESSMSDKKKKKKKADPDLAGLGATEAIVQGQQKKLVKRATREFVDVQPVEFTRIFDTSSTLLFNAMVNCDTLDSVSVVKRKGAGTSNSGEIFLRVDFDQVLMTELEWKDTEHVVIETGTFIYRELTIRYRPQKPDGSLGTIIQATWPKGDDGG